MRIKFKIVLLISSMLSGAIANSQVNNTIIHSKLLSDLTFHKCKTFVIKDMKTNQNSAYENTVTDI